MPTINEVLERTERARSSAVDDETRAAWLLELEGQLFRDMILRHKLSPGEAVLGPVGVCPKCGAVDGLIWNREGDWNRCSLCGWSELPACPVEYPRDGDVPLLVAPPDDRLYDLYLFAQTDALNREGDNYNNSAALFNAALDGWKRMWHRTHRPLGRGYYRHVL